MAASGRLPQYDIRQVHLLQELVVAASARAAVRGCPKLACMLLSYNMSVVARCCMGMSLPLQSVKPAAGAWAVP
jgi:hypothetical protein